MSWITQKRLLEILGIIDYHQYYCNIYLEDDAIVLHAKTGNFNRYHESSEIENENCRCSGCVMEYKFKANPNYIQDYDDPINPNLAYIFYTIPENSIPENCKTIM